MSSSRLSPKFPSGGQGKEAAAEFQKIFDHGGIVWNYWSGALAHLSPARVNELRARAAQAPTPTSLALAPSLPVRIFSLSGKAPAPTSLS
jgi:hypothetical protein